jgi:nucleotide-binding universal stress UspA family protein
VAFPTAVLALGQRRGLPGELPPGILAATDGRTQSDVALRAARALLASGPLGLITVLASRSPGEACESEESAELLDAIARQSLVEAQVQRVLGDTVESWVEVRSGYPPRVLAASAVAHDALLVVGLGRPCVRERLRGDESALRLVREARTPVLAVAQQSLMPPRRIVLAVDFSETSLAAARLALELAGPGAEATLAHVVPRASTVAWGSGALGYHGAPDAAIDKVLQRLTPLYGVRIKPVVLRGDVANELLDIASHERADLIAIGAHGHGPPLRPSIGVVTTRIVRCVTCSVLVAPRSNTSRKDPC